MAPQDTQVNGRVTGHCLEPRASEEATGDATLGQRSAWRHDGGAHVTHYPHTRQHATVHTALPPLARHLARPTPPSLRWYLFGECSAPWLPRPPGDDLPGLLCNWGAGLLSMANCLQVGGRPFQCGACASLGPSNAHVDVQLMWVCGEQ